MDPEVALEDGAKRKAGDESPRQRKKPTTYKEASDEDASNASEADVKPAPKKAAKGKAKAKQDTPSADAEPNSSDKAKAANSSEEAKAAPKKTAAKGKSKKEAPAAEADDSFPRNTAMPSSYSFPAVPSTHMKIVSWNVSSLKAAAGKGLPDYVKAENADVYLLQETKLQDGKSIEVLDKAHYPHQYWLSSEEKKGYSGSAVLSKVAPISTQNGIGVAEHDKEGRTITLEFEKYYLVACCGFNV